MSRWFVVFLLCAVSCSAPDDDSIILKSNVPEMLTVTSTMPTLPQAYQIDLKNGCVWKTEELQIYENRKTYIQFNFQHCADTYGFSHDFYSKEGEVWVSTQPSISNYHATQNPREMLLLKIHDLDGLSAHDFLSRPIERKIEQKTCAVRELKPDVWRIETANRRTRSPVLEKRINETTEEYLNRHALQKGNLHRMKEIFENCEFWKSTTFSKTDDYLIGIINLTAAEIIALASLKILKPIDSQKR